MTMSFFAEECGQFRHNMTLPAAVWQLQLPLPYNYQCFTALWALTYIASMRYPNLVNSYILNLHTLAPCGGCNDIVIATREWEKRWHKYTDNVPLESNLENDMLYTIFTCSLSSVERIFVGRSHVAKVAEARLEQINRYCQVSSAVWIHDECMHIPLITTIQRTHANKWPVLRGLKWQLHSSCAHITSV